MAEGVPQPQGEANLGISFKPAEQTVQHLDIGAFANGLEQNGKNEPFGSIMLAIVALGNTVDF